MKSEGEGLLYDIGGIGVFGEIGTAEAGVRPGKWNRVTISVGTDHHHPTAAPIRQDDELLGLTSAQPKLTTRRAPNYGNQFRSASSSKYFTSYVNGRTCARISSEKRGVIAQPDGRFAISPTGFNVLASNRFEAMDSGTLI